MKVWVVGHKGMLGSAVAARASSAGCEMVTSDQSLDIAESDAVGEFARLHRPDIVINCAAFTAVDAAEKDEALALRVNGTGPANLAQACLDTGASLVHVSTDYVFNGAGVEPYIEGDPVGPQNAYGRTKLAGEESIRALLEGHANDGKGSRWYVFRTSWLYGDGPSSFVETMWRLLREKPVLRVVDDQIGRPTYVEDLAAVLVRVSRLGSDSVSLPSGIWHFANQGVVSWHGFASAIRESMLHAGVAVRTETIIPVASDEYPRPAPRPKYSVLSTTKLESFGIVPRPFRAALEEYVAARVLREKVG